MKRTVAVDCRVSPASESSRWVWRACLSVSVGCIRIVNGGAYDFALFWMERTMRSRGDSAWTGIDPGLLVLVSVDLTYFGEQQVQRRGTKAIVTS